MWRTRNRYPDPDSDGLRWAKAVDARATADLARVRDNTAEVDRISDSLRETLERNHFGESIELAFRRRP